MENCHCSKNYWAGFETYMLDKWNPDSRKVGMLCETISFMQAWVSLHCPPFLWLTEPFTRSHVSITVITSLPASKRKSVCVCVLSPLSWRLAVWATVGRRWAGWWGRWSVSWWCRATPGSEVGLHLPLPLHPEEKFSTLHQLPTFLSKCKHFQVILHSNTIYHWFKLSNCVCYN